MSDFTENNKQQDFFVALPKEMLRSQQYAALTPSAIKLLIDLYVQFNGRNNGDFSLTWKIMSQKGWHSKATLERAKKELLATGFIEETRKGGRHCCSLFAVVGRNQAEIGNKMVSDDENDIVAFAEYLKETIRDYTTGKRTYPAYKTRAYEAGWIDCAEIVIDFLEKNDKKLGENK